MRNLLFAQSIEQNEIDDFWKMIWELNVHTIVMLTDPIEKEREKCSEYWKSKNCKILSEKTIYEENSVKIVERTIQISNDLLNKNITQYHLQNWPDFGSINPYALAELVQLVFKKKDDYPFLAHCSAGVGRTGAFFAAYQAYQDKNPNLFSIVSDLRSTEKGRVGIVQAEDQYILANEAMKLLLN